LDVKIPTRVVASRDDPYSSVNFAFDAAARWRAGFWEMGAKGHINAASGLGAWSNGWQDLQNFLRGIEA
jgi:predicted alpha/beta hydrolase family esterase